MSVHISVMFNKEISEWLDNIPMAYYVHWSSWVPKSNCTISFQNREDAIAFRLKFRV